VCPGDDGDGVAASNAPRVMSEELERLRAGNARLIQQQQQQQQQQERESLMMSTQSLGGDSIQLDFIHAQQELSRCKEALIGEQSRPYRRPIVNKGDLQV